MNHSRLQITLTLEPLLDDDVSSVSEKNWLENDDKDLLELADAPSGHASEGELAEATKDLDESSLDENIHTLEKLTLKRSDYGFFACTEQQDIFLNDGDIVVLPNAKFRVKLDKQTVHMEPEESEKALSTQITDEDIWGISTSSLTNDISGEAFDLPAMSSSVQEHSAQGLDFLYSRSPADEYSNLIGTQPFDQQHHESSIDMQSIIPLSGVNHAQADQLPLVPSDYSPASLDHFDDKYDQGLILHDQPSDKGNILRELGINEHSAKALSTPSEKTVTTFQEQSPLDMADEFFRDDLEAEMSRQSGQFLEPSRPVTQSLYVDRDNSKNLEDQLDSAPNVMSVFRSLKHKVFG